MQAASKMEEINRMVEISKIKIMLAKIKNLFASFLLALLAASMEINAIHTILQGTKDQKLTSMKFSLNFK